MVRPGDVSEAEIRIHTLLRFVKRIDDAISNLSDWIALPWNWKQDLSSCPSGRKCGDMPLDVPPVIQSVRHHGSDCPFPVTGDAM